MSQKSPSNEALTYHNEVRLGAQAAKGGELEQASLDIDFANYQASQLLQLLRQSPQNKAIEEAFNQRELIVSVSNLYKLFKDILRQFKFIFSNLVPLHIDPETNTPVFNLENAKSILDFLSFAHREIPNIPPLVLAANTKEISLSPNQELITLFFNVVEDESILENTAYLTKVFTLVSEYLNAVVKATDLELKKTIHSTASQVNALKLAAFNFGEQAEAKEVFDIEIDQETLQLWESFLFEIELVFAEASVKVISILGKNVKWLLEEIDVDDIRRILRECHRDLKKLQSLKREKLDSLDAQPLSTRGIFAKVFSTSNPVATSSFGELNKKIEHITSLISRLEATIEGKKSLPPSL